MGDVIYVLTLAKCVMVAWSETALICVRECTLNVMCMAAIIAVIVDV